MEKIDRAVAVAFGWNDIDLKRDFHEISYLPENDRIRFTIAENERREILQRLVDLNRERYQEEVDQGLHGRVKIKKTPVLAKKAKSETKTPTLALDLPELKAPSPNKTKDAILNFLRSRGGKHGKANIFGAVRMRAVEWSDAIEELISEGKVSRYGEAPQETYSISESDLND